MEKKFLEVKLYSMDNGYIVGVEDVYNSENNVRRFYDSYIDALEYAQELLGEYVDQEKSSPAGLDR